MPRLLKSIRTNIGMQCVLSSLAFSYKYTTAVEEQKMGAVGEKSELKLVHTGTRVEIHKKPVTAAEVLKKNPRHSVTRPDVFEYPWIVVRPESVSKLGRVYYIVPNCAIYKLIKAEGYSIQPSFQHNQSTKLLERTQPRKSSAGRIPKHKDYCQSDWQEFQATFSEEASPQEQAGGERFNRPSQFESHADMNMIAKYQSTYDEFKQSSVTDYTSEIESLDDKEYHFSEVSSSKAAASKQDDAVGIECEKQVTILKPCLRKHDSARKLLDLKVSFLLPTEHKELKNKVTESRAESPSCSLVEFCKSMDFKQTPNPKIFEHFVYCSLICT